MLMKKILVSLMTVTLLLTACGGVQQATRTPQLDEDTVLWVNADGTDCDLEDYYEGDVDCQKKKKKVYKYGKHINKSKAGTLLHKPSLKKQKQSTWSKTKVVKPKSSKHNYKINKGSYKVKSAPKSMFKSKPSSSTSSFKSSSTRRR
jgi:hypothetical protein